MCQHPKQLVKRHGYDRRGQQRVRCKACGHTWQQNQPKSMNRLTPEKELQLRIAIGAGLTERQIKNLLQISNATVVRRRIEMGKVPSVPQQPAKKTPANCCDYCGNQIIGEREAYRKTRRTEHKFCNYECYGLYQRAQRANDRCKRCKRKRKDIGLCVIFSLGMCQSCYNLLRNFDFNEEAAALFELNQRLKKEIRGARRQAQELSKRS